MIRSSLAKEQGLEQKDIGRVCQTRPATTFEPLGRVDIKQCCYNYHAK